MADFLDCLLFQKRTSDCSFLFYRLSRFFLPHPLLYPFITRFEQKNNTKLSDFSGIAHLREDLEALQIISKDFGSHFVFEKTQLVHLLGF